MNWPIQVPHKRKNWDVAGMPDGTVCRGGFEARVFIPVVFGLNGDIPLASSWGQLPE